MSSLSHDSQLSNLLAHARVSPYFDVEGAICLAMESWMQQKMEAKKAIERMSSEDVHHPLSIVKIFSWPGGELCACLHRAEDDVLFHFDTTQNKFRQMMSADPFLHPVAHGDRVLVMNDIIAKYLPLSELEQVVRQYANDPDHVLQEELMLRAQVNTRAGERIPLHLFHLLVLKVPSLNHEYA
jgi:hypothetical protein